MIVITLDSSQISIAVKCDEKWNLAGRQHLILSDVPRAALDRGTIFHKLLELYYVARFSKPVWDAAQEAIQNFLPSKEGQLADEDTRLFLIKRFREYIMHYSASDFQPMRIEEIPSIELGFSNVFYEDNHRKFIIEGKIDLLTKYREDLCFIDHKTQGRAMKIYPYTPQFLTYGMVTKAKKAVINIIRLHDKLANNTFERVPITFAPHQYEQWKKQVMHVFMRIYLVLLKAEAEGKEPVFERNYGECGGAFNSFPCQFTPLCELNPENRSMYENLKQFKYTERIWTPWEVQEEI